MSIEGSNSSNFRTINKSRICAECAAGGGVFPNEKTEKVIRPVLHLGNIQSFGEVQQLVLVPEEYLPHGLCLERLLVQNFEECTETPLDNGVVDFLCSLKAGLKYRDCYAKMIISNILYVITIMGMFGILTTSFNFPFDSFGKNLKNL